MAGGGYVATGVVVEIATGAGGTFERPIPDGVRRLFPFQKGAKGRAALGRELSKRGRGAGGSKMDV